MALYQEIDEEEMFRLLTKDLRETTLESLAILTTAAIALLTSVRYTLLSGLLWLIVIFYGLTTMVLAPLGRYLRKEPSQDPRLIEIIEPGQAPRWFVVFAGKYATIDGHSLYRHPKLQKTLKRMTWTEWRRFIQDE